MIFILHSTILLTWTSLAISSTPSMQELFVPHPTNDNLFYKLAKCPEGLVYNKQRQVCDWPHNVAEKNTHNKSATFDSNSAAGGQCGSSGSNIGGGSQNIVNNIPNNAQNNIPNNGQCGGTQQNNFVSGHCGSQTVGSNSGFVNNIPNAGASGNGCGFGPRMSAIGRNDNVFDNSNQHFVRYFDNGFEDFGFSRNTPNVGFTTQRSNFAGNIPNFRNSDGLRTNFIGNVPNFRYYDNIAYRSNFVGNEPNLQNLESQEFRSNFVNNMPSFGDYESNIPRNSPVFTSQNPAPCQQNNNNNAGNIKNAQNIGGCPNGNTFTGHMGCGTNNLGNCQNIGSNSPQNGGCGIGGANSFQQTCGQGLNTASNPCFGSSSSGNGQNTGSFCTNPSTTNFNNSPTGNTPGSDTLNGGCNCANSASGSNLPGSGSNSAGDQSIKNQQSTTACPSVPNTQPKRCLDGTEVKETCIPVGNCPSSGTVLLPYHNNCSLFCECDGNVLTTCICPNGQHFNAQLKKCVAPSSAQCATGCPKLQVTNGTRWSPDGCVTSHSKVGDECHIACDRGFELKGSDTVQCTAGGWNGTGGLNSLPTCKTPEGVGDHLVQKLMEAGANSEVGFLFILDESGSVGIPQYEMEKSFVKALIKAFPLSQNRSAGVITFSGTAEVDISMEHNETCEFLRLVDNVKYNGGNTDIRQALSVANTHIARAAVHNTTLIMLITDGASSTDPTPEANKAKSHGDVLFTVGIGNYDRRQLEPISSRDSTGAPLFYGISGFKVFNSIAEHLHKAFGSNEVKCPK